MIMFDVICPNCGSVLQWDSNDEPLSECSECGYVLSIEDDFEARQWKKNVVIMEAEVLNVVDSILEKPV
jgi:DNA-directed RNA polymerase subunit M/transcription elongation factor TFIIS